jgi:hypothetical protein
LKGHGFSRAVSAFYFCHPSRRLAAGDLLFLETDNWQLTFGRTSAFHGSAFGPRVVFTNH